MPPGSGRVCLITGASRGIGRATALALDAAGWRLSLVARSRDPLVELVRETDCEHLATVADVTREADISRAIEATVTELGRLDAVVCSAGTGAFGPTTEVTLESWNAQIDANLTGTFLVCREALKVMLPRKEGHLINILSVASKVAFPYSAAYVASKWGAYGLTKSLAEEVRREGIRVTAILPGSVDTPFWDANPNGPLREDMLRPDAVAEAVRYALDAPLGASVDEIHLMPPKGVL
jgi:NAD(P)-dependent dehydrogenase (short-subunit alcohol dehydrogenase family)